jgi:Tol biopolymer transport system component
VYELNPRDGGTSRLPVSDDGLEGGNLKWVEVSPDGRTLYLFRPGTDGGRANQLLVIDAVTGEKRTLGVYEADPRTLAVSPDGEELALIVRNRAEGSVELLVIQSDGESPARVLLRTAERPAFTSPVAWTPDGSRIVYAVPSGTGDRVLWSVASDGSQGPVPIGGDGWCCGGHDIRFHPDAQRIALPAGQQRAEVWLMTWQR